MSVFLRFLMGATVLITASFTGCILSAEQSEPRPVLRAVYGDFYPYGFTGADGNAQGFNIDVTRQLADASGYDVEFVRAENPQQFLAMLKQGEIDLTPFLALTPERRNTGLATSALGEYVLSIYVRRDHNIASIEELSGQRIGVIAGSISQSAVALLPFVQIVEYQTSDALLLPLLSGEIDAVAVVAETFDARLRANFIKDKLRQLTPALAVIPYGILVRRDLPQVHAAFEKAIEQTATPEALEVLRAAWFGHDQSIFDHPWFSKVATIVGGIALTTFALGIYSVRLRRRSARLSTENSSNRLLIDALDKMRAAIVIFDSDMKAVHWNSGFGGRFPLIVPELGQGATLEEVCGHFCCDLGFDAKIQSSEMAGFSDAALAALKEGRTDQRIVHTAQGSSFDLSMFPLGARYYAAIWVDITEGHKQQQQIALQGRELVRKNQQLLAFSAMAAHDLKSPLMQQRALVEFITEDLAGAEIVLPKEVADYFSTLTDLSGRMSLLVSDLLNFATADSDQAPPQEFVPNDRLQNIIKLAAHDPKITFDIMPDMPAVLVEPTSFDMVMRNLISNAVKHHHRCTGKISLSAFSEDGHIVIEVEDDGPGIPLKHQARVFEPFARLTKVEGTGLGLAFVRKTVAAWGGSVNLRPAPHGGCIFSISMPAARDGRVLLGSEAIPLRAQELNTVH